MNRRFDRVKGTIRRIESLGECALLTLIYYLLWLYTYSDDGYMPDYLGRGKYVLMLVYALLVYVGFSSFGAFQFGHQKTTDVIVEQWASLIIINAISYLQLALIANRPITFLPILLLTAIDFVVSFLLCHTFNTIYHTRYIPHQMLLIYGTQEALSLKFKMNSREDKYNITRQIPETEGFEAIKEEINRHDAVIISDVHGQLRNDILKYCYDKDVRTYIAPKVSDIILRGAPDVSLFDTPLLLVRGFGLTPGEELVKRGFDILLVMLSMVLAGPLMLFCAIAIKLGDRGPVFFRQERVTKDGRLFQILKFRSMVTDAEKDGIPIAATDNDPRITKVGKFLRRTRLDELPQLFNILKGDMSICGPRPERKEFNDSYTEKIPEFSYRLKVRGGLTGYAQIFGKYNTSAYDKLRLDLIYIENYSLLLDIRLIIMTIRAVLSRESTEGFAKEEDTESNK